MFIGLFIVFVCVFSLSLSKKTMRPTELLLRCYARKTRSGHWYVRCIDLNIDSEAPTFERAKLYLEHALIAYFQTVLDTKDKDSIVYLIKRKSSWRHLALYYLIKYSASVSATWRAFKEPIPFQIIAKPSALCA
jgi:hypothetical protein